MQVMLISSLQNLMRQCTDVLLLCFESILIVVMSPYSTLAALQDQPSSKQKSITFFEHDKSTNELLPACVEIPTDGTDEWEIDMKQLKIEKKVACGSYGEL